MRECKRKGEEENEKVSRIGIDKNIEEGEKVRWAEKKREEEKGRTGADKKKENDAKQKNEREKERDEMSKRKLVQKEHRETGNTNGS